MKNQKKITLSVLLCFLLLVFLSLNSCSNVRQRANTVDNWETIQKKGKVIVGLDDSFVPMGFREKSGKLVGYDIDLARAVFKKYGIKVDFQTIDWSMKETELRNKTIDLIWNGYTKTSAREKNVAFSKTYLKNEQILVTKKASGIKNAAGMKDKILGVQSGSSGYQSYTDNPQVLKKYVHDTVQYDTFNNAFMDLNAGRIQGLLIDSVYANYYIKHQKNAKDYEKTPIGFPTEDFAVGMRKGDKTLRSKINGALQELYRDGTMKKISQKWFGVDNSVEIGK
ncbi:amino acid ABC transporter substrate-binding protein [Liquorilactobacillus oeni]|uniref:Polar amino acid ABC transporter substrate-binding protein n=1 Tax=Liquorilactobacillus oeni DSM 19972 TaxID=1423777 RepID=A0A0R1M7T7_9LACO|nr:amino acid ABC transporter substrate-binding protein [Liquorilactobacillus oeni]KRL04206.1 polar amino acid ABC transporter substrate-binding protein [Liquorilactobacillus oeni DSM 19972]